MLSFFFLNVGLQVDLSSLTSTSVILLAVLIIVVAILTKYIDRMWPPAVDYDKVLTEEAEAS